MRIFLAVAAGGTPPRPAGPADMHPTEDTGAASLFETACHRDGVFQKMLDFRSRELGASIAERVSRLAEPKESAIYLFAVALDHSSGGVELGMETARKLKQFARRWKDSELVPAQYKRILGEGEAHFSGKVTEFGRLAAALLRQIKAAERQRLARIYDIQEFRAMWKKNQSRQAAIARDESHLARKLKICSGRC